MNNNDIDTAKYLEDIRTIKELLLKTENQPVYENWAFYAWGILIISAGIVHYFVEAAYKLGMEELFLKIWLPAIFIGGFIEIVSLIRNLEKNSLTIFSKTIFKLYLSIIGQTTVFISLILLIIKLNGIQYLPVIFLLITAGWYFILALSAYTQLFFHAFAFIIIAFSFYILNIDHRIMVPVVSTIIGISSLTVAFTTTYKKRQSSRTDRAG